MISSGDFMTVAESTNDRPGMMFQPSQSYSYTRSTTAVSTALLLLRWSRSRWSLASLCSAVSAAILHVYSSTGLTDAGTLPVVAAVRYPSRLQSLLWRIHHDCARIQVGSCTSGSAPAGGTRNLHDVYRRPSTDRQNSHCKHKGGLAHARPNYVTWSWKPTT